MKIELYNHRLEVDVEKLTQKNIVVIDVLRATSVMVNLMQLGVSSIIPCESIEEAKALAANNESFLLAGERNAKRIEGFHLGNSPLEATRELVENKVVIMTTTNGTATLKKCDIGEPIYIAAFSNTKALAKHLINTGKDLVIVCSGTDCETSTDDVYCAGKLINALKKLKKDLILSDMASIAWLLYDCNKNATHAFLKETCAHYNRLLKMGAMEDLQFCFAEFEVSTIPTYLNGTIGGTNENSIITK